MKKRIIFTCLVILTFANSGFSQEEQGDKKEFTLSGSPVVTVFANFHSGIGAHNDESGFELTRAYLGYQFKLSPTVSGRAIVDAGIPVAGSTSNEVALKNALLTWKDKGFTVNGGLIGLLQFDLQEKFWQNRYIAPSFQDLYKMGSSADLGVTAAYQFTRWISADLSFTNGEGYRKLNSHNNNYRYGAGVTSTPLKGLTLRAYTDVYDQDNKKNQQTLAFFAGYECKAFSLGTEYNYQKNQQLTEGNDYYGYSVYANIPLAQKWKLFARYDHVDSKDIEDKAWFINARDLVIAGFEYQPLKQLRIAPNYKYAVNELAKGPFHEVYLNVGFYW